MKSLPICFFVLALAGILLTACAAQSEDGSYTFDGEELSKAQVLVLTGADGEELGTITDLDTIDALVDGLSTEDWTPGEHAGDAQPDLVVSLYQEPTETVLGEDGAELIHLLDLAAYSEDMCIELRLAAVPLHLDFQVPKSALDALNRLTES